MNKQISRLALIVILSFCKLSLVADQNDPWPIDPDYPPISTGVPLDVEGSTINGLFYGANGPGPHPGVLLLHGYPGNEKNLDIAQALRRAGFNVLFIHYRGAWGSEGYWSLRNAIEDAAKAYEMLATEPKANVDPERISVVGHSMGGFTALHLAAREENLKCGVALAFVNLGAYVRQATDDPEQMAALEQRLSVRPTPLNWEQGYTLFEEIRDHADELDLLEHIPALSKRRLFILSALRDQIVDYERHHLILMNAFKKTGAPGVEEYTLDADHSFSAHRLALTNRVVGWMTENCR